jgi:hypothetical protein
LCLMYVGQKKSPVILEWRQASSTSSQRRQQSVTNELRPRWVSGLFLKPRRARGRGEHGRASRGPRDPQPPTAREFGQGLSFFFRRHSFKGQYDRTDTRTCPQTRAAGGGARGRVKCQHLGALARRPSGRPRRRCFPMSYASQQHRVDAWLALTKTWCAASASATRLPRQCHNA